jgi:peptidoglycan/xylan/chitin deacetylase (PgdA/CDA1 family)
VFLPLYLDRTGRTTIMWDVEPESFSDIAEDPAKITQHVLEKVQPGSIIILHVMYKSREASRQALPGIIDGLQERGYRIVPVRELLKLS